MPIRVQVPGHGIVEFPDGTSQEEMAHALTQLPTAAPEPAMNFAVVNGQRVDLSGLPADIQKELQDHSAKGDLLLANIKNLASAAATAAPYVGGAVGGLAGAVGGPVSAMVGAAAGGALGDRVKHAASSALGTETTQTPAAQLGSMAKSAAVQGLSEGAGQAIGAGMRAAGPWLMQKALKPTASVLSEYQATAPKLVRTLLDEGVSVTQAGLDKLQRLFTATNDEIRDAVANATGTISKKSVAARVLPTASKIAQQVNPKSDLRAVGATVKEFMNHPVYKGTTLTIPEAQAMKVGTYQQIGKKYGEVASASIEAQKSLARGLKEELAAEVPGLAGLNARDSDLMAALDAVGRRVALAGNKDPVGFAWVAAHPMTFLAALFDRNPAVKSLVARGLYQSAASAAKVTPQAIRTALASLASLESGGEPAPASSEK